MSFAFNARLDHHIENEPNATLQIGFVPSLFNNAIASPNRPFHL